MPATGRRRPRLLDDRDFLPWVRAQDLSGCSLFWLPVRSFPLSFEEKQWLTRFQERLAARLEGDFDLRAELFFQYKAVTPERSNDFLRYRQKCMVLMGLGRRPGAELPTLPDAEQLREMVQRGDTLDLNDWVGDYLYWFVMKQPARQRELFLGTGGLVTVFLPPDPSTKAPPLPYTPKLRAAHPAFQRFDVDAMHAATYAMSDAFLEKSKTMFGTGLEERANYDGLPFILPLPDSGHFFAVSPDVRESWFELFDIYINESVADKGILLAYTKDFDSPLLDVLESMNREGMRYPTGVR